MSNGLILPPGYAVPERIDDGQGASPITRMWHFRDAKSGVSVRFECPYWAYLVDEARTFAPEKQLNSDFGAHALWHYFLVASNQWWRATKGLVYEGQGDPRFNGKTVFDAIATVHGVAPYKMSNYWPMIEKQRRALGFSSNAELPEKLKFRYY